MNGKLQFRSLPKGDVGTLQKFREAERLPVIHCSDLKRSMQTVPAMQIIEAGRMVGFGRGTLRSSDTVNVSEFYIQAPWGSAEDHHRALEEFGKIIARAGFEYLSFSQPLRSKLHDFLRTLGFLPVVSISGEHLLMKRVTL